MADAAFFYVGADLCVRPIVDVSALLLLKYNGNRMKYDPEIHHRRSIRLQGYDYSQVGWYFVTICIQHRRCLLGKISDGEMHLNDAGRMVSQWYFELANKFSDIRCEEFICMPNHIHFIVANVGVDLHTRISSENPSGSIPKILKGEHLGSPLHRVVQWFKTMSTNEYIRGVKRFGWQQFSGKFWQRNYWEHIVRNDEEMSRICEYIKNNPVHWEADKLFIEEDTCVLQDSCDHPDSERAKKEGRTHRSAPTEIREFLANYGKEIWMV